MKKKKTPHKNDIFKKSVQLKDKRRRKRKRKKPENNENKVKRPAGRPKKRGRRRSGYRTLDVVTKGLFEDGENDLKYITENKSLFEKHKRFIRSRKYYDVVNKHIRDISVEIDGKILKPIQFSRFTTLYPYIAERWIHLLRSCYDKSYYFYKFIGARGVGISSEFFNAKYFCLWCLRHGLTSKLGSYKEYMVRKDKTRHYSYFNCVVVKEKDIHSGKAIRSAIDSILLARAYEICHEKNVSFMTAYTRLFVWDMCIEDAISHPGPTLHKSHEASGFSPTQFYADVADENSCSLSTFMSRISWHYTNGKIQVRPYDILKPEFSISEAYNAQGKLSYKQVYYRKEKEEARTSQDNYVNDKLPSSVYFDKDNEVYS